MKKTLAICILMIIVCFLSCVNSNTKERNIHISNTREIIYSSSIETDIKKQSPFEGYLNPLYSLANQGTEIDFIKFSSVKEKYNILNDFLITSDSLRIEARYGNILFENNDQFNYNTLHYQGENNELGFYIVGVEDDELYRTILLNKDSLQSFSLGGDIYISSNKRYLITAINFSDPIYHGYYEIYSIKKTNLI